MSEYGHLDFSKLDELVAQKARESGQIVTKYKDFNIYMGKDKIYFEHVKRGDVDSCCVFLENGRVYDYDGCFAMPNEAGQWLSKEGYNVYWDGEFWNYD